MHAERIGEFRGAQRSVVGLDDQIVVICGTVAVLVDHAAVFNVDEPARQRRARACDLDALAAQRLVDGRGVRVLLQTERQRIQLLLDGRGGVVADRAYLSAAAVKRSERLQHVVQLRRGEVDGHALVAAHRASMLKVADAILVEHYFAHRQIGDCARSRALRWWRWLGCGMRGSLGCERNGNNGDQNGRKHSAHIPSLGHGDAEP